MKTAPMPPMLSTTLEHLRPDQICDEPPDGHPNSPAYGHLKLPHLN